MMRKWMKALFFLLAIWSMSDASVCAEEGILYTVTAIYDNNKPMLFETGTVLTEEMLPDKILLRAEVQGEGGRQIGLELPVTWNLDECQEETAGFKNFVLTGELNLPSGCDTAEEFQEPKLQIVYRKKGAVADLTGRYRGGAVILWFNHLGEEYPYYAKIPDAGRVWMEYSGDGKSWEREEIAEQKASYMAEKIFDGTPVMIRLYVESGMQAGYSNTIWLPYAPGGENSNDGEEGSNGDKDENDDDDIGGNRGGGSAILPVPRLPQEEPEGTVNAGVTDVRIPNSIAAKEADGVTTASENEKKAEVSGIPDRKQTDKASGGSDTAGASDAVSNTDSGEDTASDADTGVPLRIWIAGIGLLLLCIATGAGIMKLIGYYKG